MLILLPELLHFWQLILPKLLHFWQLILPELLHFWQLILPLLAYAPDALQTMLNRLVVYPRSKHLTINTAKSEVVHFFSKCVLH